MVGRRKLLIGIASVCGAGAGVFVGRLLSHGGTAESEALQNLVLPDLDGRPQNLNQWKDKILVANFWATWCEPCRKEIPVLVKAQQEYAAKGVQLLGISIDTVANVQKFIPSFNINYPLVMGGLASMDVMRRLGNVSGGLPFTVLVGPGGRPIQRHLGPLNEAQLADMLKTMLS